MIPLVDTTNAHLSSPRATICGASGRMGTRIVSLAQQDGSLRIAAQCASKSSFSASVDGSASVVSIASLLSTPPSCDVVIDFTSPEGVVSSLALAMACNAAILVGTTGLPDAIMNDLRGASTRIPVLVCANTSVGIAATSAACAMLARVLGSTHQSCIIETHHDQKRDAPSGTALRLASAVTSAGGKLSQQNIFAFRAGDVVGEHTVRFIGPGEVIEITHRATSRDLFARGAIRLAAWLARQTPEWYTVEQAMGLHPSA